MTMSLIPGKLYTVMSSRVCYTGPVSKHLGHDRRGFVIGSVIMCVDEEMLNAVRDGSYYDRNLRGKCWKLLRADGEVVYIYSSSRDDETAEFLVELSHLQQ